MKTFLLLGLAVLPLAAAPSAGVTIVMPRYHEYVDGPVLPRNHKYHAGDTVYLSFEIAGYQPVDEKIDITYVIAAADPKDVPLIPLAGGKVNAELAQEDKKWTPKVRGEVAIPLTAPSGLYHIDIKVIDNFGKATAEEKLAVQVTGREIEPSDTLAVRKFEFLRRDEDREPLPSPSYRPGDAVYVRFYVVGFTLGEKHRTGLKYGVRLTNAKGDVLTDVPAAPSDAAENFYPPRFAPYSFSIELAKDTPPGEYTLLLRLHDDISGQSLDIPQAFRVEK